MSTADAIVAGLEVQVAPVGEPGRLPRLTAVGLSAEADLAYRELVRSGPRRPGDLSRALGVAASVLRQALDELADVGAAAAVRRPGGSARVRLWAAAPADRVAAEVARQRQAAALALQRLHRQVAGPTALGIDPAGRGVQLIGSPAAAQARLLRLTRAGPRELLSMNPDSVVTAVAVQAATVAHASLIRDRSVIRDLSVPPLPPDATGALTEELAANGSQFRELPSLPTRILLFDRATALVRLDPVDSRRGVLEITAASTVGALVQTFLRHWDRATPSRGSAEVGLTARELAVVQLHLAGLTDAAAAGQLGVSERTVAYTVRGLMDRFGVTNRFQLGLALCPVLTGHHGPAGHSRQKETDT